jgi:type I protein arginine methyltransferase
MPVIGIENNNVIMYTIAAYGRMIADRVRMEAYVEALRQAVKPGSVLLDIGTGTGILALLACQFGARRVYAVEPSNAIQIAREIASANGYAGRVEFIQDISTRVTLPEQAHVIVSDMHGVLPLFEQNVPSLIDARRRHLAPGGTMIPRQENLWIAVVEAPELYRRHTTPWDENAYSLDMRAALQRTTNTWEKGRVAPEQLLVEPKSWATLDYGALESPNVSAQVTWAASRAGIGHGLIIWFDSIVANGVSFSNAPGASELIFGSAFFPLSEPITVIAGDTLSVFIQANLVGEDYLWRWDTRVLEEGNSNKIKADFKQSTFFGVPLSSARLHKRASNHVPALNEAGLIERFVLSLMDGENSLEQIAKRVAAQFPDCFVNDNGSLAYVGDVAEKYSR